MKLLRNIIAFSRSSYRPLAQKCFCTQATTEKNIVKSQLSTQTIPNLNLHEFLLEKIERWPDHTALVCYETGRNYTYAQSDILSTNLAQVLCAKLGFQKGDVIAVMLPNIPEYMITYLALFKAGFTITTINPVYTSDEIARQMKDSKAKAVITLTTEHSTVEKSIQILNSNIKIPIITIKTSTTDSTPAGAIDFKELCAYNGPQIKLGTPSLEDLAVVAYSSGTSGLPKGVTLVHRNIVSDLVQLQHDLVKLNYETTTSYQDCIPIVPPIFHCYGMIPLLFNMFSQGGKCVLLPKYRPDLFLDMLEKYPSQIIHLVPPILLMLSTNAQAQKHHFSTMRNVVCAAAPLAATDIERFKEKFGKHITVTQMYGLTETGPVTHTQRHDKPISPGSIGWNLSLTECKIVSVEDETKNLGPNESGHLLLRGPNIMNGYLNNIKATEETIDKDGWLKTGDICYYDEEGQFFVTDRIKELIKVKGFQVAPAELEALIREHPDVDDAAVIGIKHEQHGETPKAFVVPRMGSNLKTQQIQEFVKEKAAKYKQLTGGVVFVDSIPKNPSGKIMRRMLKDL